MVRIIIISCLIVLAQNPSFAQKKKDIKNAGISRKVEWQYINDNGSEKKYMESEYEYDQKGNTLLEKLYDENGNIVKHKEYKYDSNGNEVLQITYNPKGQIVEREETTYRNDLKIEKKVYGPDGKLKSRKVFEYKTFK